MIYIVENFLPIFVATIAAFFFGGAYYRIFRQRWLRAAEINAEKAETQPSLFHYMAIFVAEFWMAAILAGAIILAPPEADNWTMAFGSAIIIWVGFVLPALFVSYRLIGLSNRLIALDTAHWFIAMVIMAGMIEFIGVQAPIR